MIIATTLGCSKKKEAEPTAPLQIEGSKWKYFWYRSSGGEQYYYRLDFKSSTKVDYYITYINDVFITSEGKAELNYTVSGDIVSVSGTLNSISGEKGKGNAVNYTLKYTPQMNTILPSLNGDGKNYVKTN